MTGQPIFVQPVLHRQIVIRPMDSKYTIAVEPACDGDPQPETFTNRDTAISFAGGLRLAKGWPVKEIRK